MCLGRTQEFKDIFIKGTLEREGIHASPEALEETLRLQNIFDETVRKLKQKAEAYWKISYLNVRSLNWNHEHVEKDNFLTSSDIFGLGETWLRKGEEKYVTGFTGVFSNHGKGKGVAAFSKIKSIRMNSFASEKFSFIHQRHGESDVIFVYLSSGCNKEEVFCHLKARIDIERPTAIIGDFNIDSRKNDKFIKALENTGFVELMKESTCDTGSWIDHIYINEPLRLLDTSVQRESVYFSDHDIITLYIPK